MIYEKADEVIEETFQSFISRYKMGLNTSVRGSDFFFNYFDLLYYKCHQVTPNWSGSCIDSHYWIKNKETTINSINKKEEKCFQ